MAKLPIRFVLLSLYFGVSPGSLEEPSRSFDAIKDKWIVAPVVDSLIYRSGKVSQ